MNSRKTYYFLLLLDAYKLSAISMFIIDDMAFSYISATFISNKVFEDSREGPPQEYRAYKDKKSCAKTFTKEHIGLGSKQLIIATKKP